MPIQILSPTLINQIAAGEVIERPASALKELVENALDAQATSIEVMLGDGGKSYLSVLDNGIGMGQEDLKKCVQRHATSKLSGGNLFDIKSFGFRGEALPSIGSVARLTITSRQKDSTEAWSIVVEGSSSTGVIYPASMNQGTKVEVKDLFFATPARLKFLKATQTEVGYIKDVIKHLAMAHPEVSFRVSDEKKQILFYPATKSLKERVEKVIGNSFGENSISVHAEHDGFSLTGFASLPTYTRSTSSEQHLFVNGRWIKDRILVGCIKGAYQGLLGVGSGYPVVALFLNVPLNEVDVNVHPAKTEVRFKENGIVRGLIVTSIKSALAESGYRTATTIGIGALDKAQTHILPEIHRPTTHINTASYTQPSFSSVKQEPVSFVSYQQNPHYEQPLQMDSFYSAHVPDIPTVESIPEETTFPPLGLARGQVLETYIISQTQDSIIITDQHAAHERLTYEKIRAAFDGHVETQLLLIPEIIKIEEESAFFLSENKEEIKKLGFTLDVVGGDSVIVREIPAFLNKTNIQKLVKDMVDTFKEFGAHTALEDKIQAICARMACHNSVRAGRILDVDEMNALLRQMEKCGKSGQCIHGRPTYIELKLSDIERLFGRRA